MEIAALIFGVLSFIFSVINFIELRAQAKSTHQVQFIDPWKDEAKKLDDMNQEIKENISYDNLL